MNRARTTILALVAVLAPGSLLACGDDAATDPTPDSDAGDAGRPDVADGGADTSDAAGGEPVTLTFEARVGGTPFSCSSTFPGLGTAQTTVTPLDFRLYVHDVRLVAANGVEVPVALDQDGAWQTANVALLDFEDGTGTCANGTPQTNASIHGTAPPGFYTGVRFKLGVPEELNHRDVTTAPPPLNVSGLFWSWKAGYKFARLDVRTVPEDGGAPVGFEIHLGSTACTGEPPQEPVTCARKNVANISLSGDDPRTRSIVIDYAALVEATDLGGNLGGMPGCMSDPEDPDCPPILERFGLDPVTGKPAQGQKLFRFAEL